MVRGNACRFYLLLSCAVLFASSTLFAQNDRAGVTGRVVDSTGAVVSGATVKITNTATGQEVGLTTNPDGNYAEPAALHPGPSKVEVSPPGFQPPTHHILLHLHLSR